MFWVIWDIFWGPGVVIRHSRAEGAEEKFSRFFGPILRIGPSGPHAFFNNKKKTKRLLKKHPANTSDVVQDGKNQKFCQIQTGYAIFFYGYVVLRKFFLWIRCATQKFRSDT